MKRILLSFFVLILTVLAYSQAKPKVIVNPSYEVKSSGVYNVSKIELTDTETRLTIHSTFVPYWWIAFSKKEDFIRDCITGKTYEITGIEGAELDKQIWMKGSGDSTIVLIYPPLDPAVTKIDYGTCVYGISLDNSKAGERLPSTVPVKVAKWIDQDLAKVKDKVPIDLNSPMFFSKGTARLIGCIKGYDTRLGFTTGLIYSSNEITREDYPTVVEIQPDGRFEVDLPYDFPKHSNLLLKDMWIPFYLEPGQTLSLILDWEQFLIADRKRNIRYQIQDVNYQGPLAKINSDLTGFVQESFNYEEFRKKKSTISPEDFRLEQIPVSQSAQNKLEDYIRDNKISPQASRILHNKVLLENATHLFDFVSDRRYFASQDTANKMLQIPVQITYYDFLKEMPLNDNSLLTSGEFASFVNRFEFCEPLLQAKKYNQIKTTKPEKDYLTYLIDEGVEISPDDKVLASLMMKEKRTKDEDSILESKKVEVQAFLEKNKDHIQGYSEKYIKPMQKAGMANFYQESWQAKDSVLHSDLGMENSLVYEIAKIRSLKYIFGASSKEAAKGFWDKLQKGITHPYLIETGNQLLETTFPAEKLAAYTLPKGTATDVFRKITDPFKGKILFVDFWATTCAPCVAGIQTMKPNREKYKDSKDFEFIFITDERGSPKDAYDKFVAEQGMKNTYRLSKDEYNYLRQLFKFNGIPHYTVIDKAGNVLNNNFPMHNFEGELSDILSN